MASASQGLDSALVYLVGLIGGGLSLGFGLVSLYYSVGWSGGPLNQDFAAVGFSGLDDLGLLRAASYSFGCILAGVITLVILNANAWKSTEGGY